MARPRPAYIQLRPVNKGKNTSLPGHAIDNKEGTEAYNVRYDYGQVQSRPGFKEKYLGSIETILEIARTYNSDASIPSLVFFGTTKLFQNQSSADILQPIDIVARGTITGSTTGAGPYDPWITIPAGAAGDTALDSVVTGVAVYTATNLISKQTITYVDKTARRIYLSAAADANSGGNVTIYTGLRQTLTTVLATDLYNTAVGEGTFDFSAVDGGSIPVGFLNAMVSYPSGSAAWADILVWTNRQDGTFVVVYDNRTGAEPLTCQKIYDTDGVGFDDARAVAIFNQRLVIGGTTSNNSEIIWSAVNDFEDFGSAGTGSFILGDSNDWVQRLEVFKEFLMCYKERSIWMGRRTGLPDPAIQFEPITSDGIGLYAPRSLVNQGEVQFFLGRDNVYAVSQRGVQPIGDPIKEELFGRGGGFGILPEYKDRAFGVLNREFDEYWLFIPTGRFPVVSNLLTRPTMSHVHATFTSAPAAQLYLEDIPQAVFDLIQVGSTCTKATATLTTYGKVFHKNGPGVGGESGNYVYLDDQLPGPGAITTAVFGNDDNWLGWGPGTITSIETKIGGSFGGSYQRVTMAGGGSCQYSTYLTIADATGAGQVYSIVAYVRFPQTVAQDSCNLMFYEYDAAGVVGTLHSQIFVRSVLEAATEVYDGSWFKVGFNVTTVDADFAKFAVGIQYSGSVVVDVDAVQVCNITNIDPQYVTTFTWDDTNLVGATTVSVTVPGFRDINNEVQAIPLITVPLDQWLCDTAWIYNYRNNAWSTWALPATAAIEDKLASGVNTIADLNGTIADIQWRYGDQQIATDSPSVILGGLDTQGFEISPAYSYDWEGTDQRNILSRWVSKDFHLETPHQDKTWSRLIIFHEVSHSAIDLQVRVSTDSGVTWGTTQTVTVRTGFTETFCDFFVTGPQARFEVQTSTAPGFYLTGFTLKVVPRGETYAY